MGKGVLMIFGRFPSPWKLIHWITNGLKYLANFLKSISWAQNRVFAWCDLNKTKFRRRCQTCLFPVFWDAWGRNRFSQFFSGLKKYFKKKMMPRSEGYQRVSLDKKWMIFDLSSCATPRSILLTLNYSIDSAHWLGDLSVLQSLSCHFWCVNESYIPQWIF